jgi:hypothetical protein
MSKYFDTKPGSLEEAVSAAQQAAIAISKKEKGEKPKNEDQGQFSFVAAQAKKNGDKQFTFAGKKYDTETEELIKEETLDEKVEYVEYKFKNKNDAMAAKKMLDAVQLMKFDINDDNISNGELMVDAGSKDMTKYHKEVMKKFKPKVMKSETNKNDKSDDGDGLDAVQPKAVKKKFDDRKDKDIKLLFNCFRLNCIKTVTVIRLVVLVSFRLHDFWFELLHDLFMILGHIFRTSINHQFTIRNVIIIDIKFHQLNCVKHLLCCHCIILVFEFVLDIFNLLIKSFLFD